MNCDYKYEVDLSDGWINANKCLSGRELHEVVEVKKDGPLPCCPMNRQCP